MHLKSEILLPLEALNFTLERQLLGAFPPACIVASLNLFFMLTMCIVIIQQAPHWMTDLLTTSWEDFIALKTKFACMSILTSTQESRHLLIVQYLEQHTSIRSVVLPAGCMLWW